MRKSSGFRTAEIILLSFTHFVHDIYTSFLSPLLPLIIEKLSLSLAQAGGLSAVMQLPALLNPLIGMAADRVSLRLFVILAPTLTAVPMSLIGVAPSYGVLVVLLLIAGVSTALFHVPAPVIIARMSGNRTGAGMSFFMTGGELARTLGPVAAVSAVALWGLEGFYPVMLAGIAASCMLLWKFRQVDLDFHQEGSDASLFETFRKTRHLFIPLALILLARSFMHGAMTAFLPTFIKEQSGSLWLGGAGLALFEAAGVAGVLAAGWLSDIIGRRRMLAISLLAAPVGVLAFVMSAGVNGSAGADMAVVASLVITGFSLLSTTPVMLAMVQEHASESPAAANGIYMMLAFVARSSVVVLIGIAGDFLGLRSVYFLSAAAGATAILFVKMLPSAPGP